MNSNVDQDMSQVKPSPSLTEGQLWSQANLLATLGVGKKTLQRWEQAGLLAIHAGTKEVFYRSNDVIDVMVKIATGDLQLKQHQPKYKQE